MKRILFAAILIAGSIAAFGQTTSTDTTKKNTDTTKNDDSDWSIRFKKHHHDYNSYPRAYVGLTFSRFDLGFATLIDNGNFTLSPQNQFLRYNQWKTSNVGFDVFQMGIRVSHNFKVYLAGGLDWTLIHLRDNETILRDQPVLTARPDAINYSKNRFSSSYLRIPLAFDFRTNEDHRGNRWHIVAGPEVGFLLDGMVKQISAENGKQKFNDTYNFTTFRYGGVLRLGYSDFGIFAKYYFNDMFENSPQQAGLKNFSFGLTVGF